MAILMSNSQCRNEILPELLRGLTGFQTVVVGKRMSGDLLPLNGGNVINQRTGKMVRIAVFTITDLLLQVSIGAEPVILIGRQQ